MIWFFIIFAILTTLDEYLLYGMRKILYERLTDQATTRRKIVCKEGIILLTYVNLVCASISSLNKSYRYRKVRQP